MDVRKNTNKVLELADNGMISWRSLAEMALKWMSEDDVEEMAKANELFYEEDEDEEEVLIDTLYHDASEEELRAMGCFGNLNEDEEN